MAKQNKEFYQTFNEGMQKQFKEYKKIDKRLESYEELMDKIKYTTEKYRQETKDQLRDIIGDVVKKQTLNNKRLVEIEQSLRTVDRNANEIKKLSGQTQLALERANEQYVF